MALTASFGGRKTHRLRNEQLPSVAQTFQQKQPFSFARTGSLWWDVSAKSYVILWEEIVPLPPLTLSILRHLAFPVVSTIQINQQAARPISRILVAAHFPALRVIAGVKSSGRSASIARGKAAKQSRGPEARRQSGSPRRASPAMTYETAERSKLVTVGIQLSASPAPEGRVPHPDSQQMPALVKSPG